MLYDAQAARYDERVGVPEDAARAVARAVDRIAGLAPDAVVAEVGVGTGIVTFHLLDYPIRYVGFDSSPAMLEIFREKLERAGRVARATLVVADGNEDWPFDDASADVVLSTRAMHHIEVDHALAEARRVMRPGGWLILGTVRRPDDSPKSEMRRAMRRLLREHGVAGRNHSKTTEELFSALQRDGAQRLEPYIAASWSHEHRPSDSLAAWRQKNGLAGDDIDDDVKRSVLDAVEAWARERYGDIDRPLEQHEHFELQAIHIAKR